MDDTSHSERRDGVPVVDFDLFAATTREGSDEAWRAAA